MEQYTYSEDFLALQADFEASQEQARRDAFRVEPRPVPEEFTRTGLPLGHIALVGDFMPLDEIA